MSPAFPTLVGLGLWLIAGTAHGQDMGGRSRLQVLPLSRAEVGLWELGIPADARRLVLRGTLSSSLDGSLYDALGALGDDRLPNGRPSLLRLPRGTRLLEADHTRHRYVVELPRGAERVLRLDTGPLSRAHWTTQHAARESLSGAIEVGSLDGGAGAERPARPSQAGAITPMDASDVLGWALWGALLPLMALLVRIRRAPERVLSARAHRALGRLRAEQRCQGPVFAELVGAAEELWQREGQAALAQLRAAIRARRAFRIAHATLDSRKREALSALAAVVQALEHSAASVTDHGVIHLDQGRLRAHQSALHAHTTLSIEADREARAL